MNKLLKVLETIAVFPFCIILGLLLTVFCVILCPVYICDVIIGDIWGCYNREEENVFNR